MAHIPGINVSFLSVSAIVNDLWTERDVIIFEFYPVIEVGTHEKRIRNFGT